MDAIIQFFQSQGWDVLSLVKAAGVLLIGVIVFGAIGRFAFGKKSTLSIAVSSVIAILFMYTLTAVLRSAGLPLAQYITPLPFATFKGDALILFSFKSADYLSISREVLNMIILAFLVNLADRWLPRGKNVFVWFLLRCATVVLALVLHLVATGLINRFLPEGILTYAPVILLGILAIMLLTGALKIVVGAVLTTVNPLIAALYTFFFANVVGKMVTRAVLTTGLLALLVLALQYVGVTVISVASAALIAYIPLLLILVVMWFIVCKIL